MFPFSTSGGTSSCTRPLLTAASPTTLRIAARICSGVACAPSAAIVAARPPITTARRVAPRFRSPSLTFLVSVLQGGEESHHILDLLGRQYRLAAISRRHPIEAVEGVV